MSNFPNSLDNDTTLPFVNNNITEVGGDAINALRDVVFALEQNIGIGAAGTAGSIASRIGILINPDGSPNSSAITSLGLVTLPITNNQIANNAGIPESKLKLDHRTQDLFNYINNAQTGLNTALGWITTSGVKLDPHIFGALYRHTLAQIDVSTDQVHFPFLLNNLRLPRDNSNGYTIINDINNEFLDHQWADGSQLPTIHNIVTNDQSVYPSNYAHTSSGIFLNTARFTTVPQTANDMQQFAQFIDNSGIFLLGTRLQNLYSNGVSRESRSSSLINDGYGAPLVPVTSVISYLKSNGTSSVPVDDINVGDDIIEFKPSTSSQASNIFDTQFALVKIGDIVTINYGHVEVQFLIKEKKYIQNSGNKKYTIRIAGKNLQYSTTAVARIDRPLFNNNKYGVLAVAAANNNSASIPGSLIVGTARGAQALGIGFDPDLFDASHYLLYLALYPDGNPADGYVILPPVDVTGNRGNTPGLYTLDSIVENTNFAFRQSGYNYRFIAFQYQGEFGIMLADSYNNAGFSILNGVVAPGGTFDPTATPVTFSNNVVGVFPATIGLVAPDPLGFSVLGANIASPAYQSSYASAEAALLPTKIFLPLKRNNFYVNGTEREKLNIDVGQIIDGYGDGYWIGTIISQSVIPGPTGRVETVYNIPLDLSTSQLKIGKTIVMQSFNNAGTFPVDFGRFIIQSLSLPCSGNSVTTQITVYDAVHGIGISPVPTAGVNTEVAIYFSSDSVSINQENSSDYSAVSPFKRHIEVYIDDNSNTFTQERGRFYIGNSNPIIINGNVPLYSYSELAKLNLIKISPKLRGYQFGSVNKITLNMTSYDGTTGVFDGYLSSWDGTHAITNAGPLTFGKKGEVTRFYDETNVDYIDILFDLNTPTSTFTMRQLDIQLFPTLSLDNEQILIATCQYNDSSTFINYVKDERQFGNVGIKELSTSALQLLSLPERLLHGNGIIRGFDLEDVVNPNNSQIYLTGGEVLVNGNFIQLDAATINIPLIKEFPSFNVNWILCINQQGEYQPIPLLDFDPTVGTPSNPIRLFLAFNLLNGQTYNLDATTFSDLVNKRKDLTPLYIVTSTTVPGSGSTLPTITLTLSDVRKYVNDIDTNFALTFTSSVAQGNFRNPVSILNWIKYNNQFNGTAILGGVNASITTPVVLGFDHNVIIDGKNNATLTLNGLTTLGSNVSVKNLIINFNGGIIVNANVANVLFDNCTLNINVPGTSPPSNVIFDMIGSNNITFSNCTINTVYTALYDDTQIFRGSVFRFTNSSNMVFDNIILDVEYLVSPGIVTPGNIFTLVNSQKMKITNSIFSGNFNQFVNNNSSNLLTIQNSTVTSTYNPNAGGSPDSYNGVAYSSTDLVNNGQGYIYSNVTSTLTDIKIDNVNFNYHPAVAGNNRYSFINFELSTNTSFLGTVKIVNCKFNNLNVATTVDDYRSVISIVNTAPVSTTTQPILFNVVIDQNVCNKNQAIIITSKTNSGHMVYPGLVSQNCEISNNVCGAIGYWVASENKFVSIAPNINALNDKMAGLLINDNICHYISNLDGYGQYFLVQNVQSGTTVNKSEYPSGNVQISDNKCNWIHVGIAYEEKSSLHITDNILHAYDTAFLVPYNEVLPNVIYDPSNPTINISSNYAIFVAANKHVNVNTQSPGEGADSCCIISGNITNFGYWQNSLFGNVTYSYGSGYIYCQSSCTVDNNILKGSGPATGVSFNSAQLILLGGNNSIVTNNKIYKGTNSILSYVNFINYEAPTPWAGDTSTGTVINNFIDAPSLMPLTASKLWNIERNKNQRVNRSFSAHAGNHTFVAAHNLFPGTLPNGITMLIQDDDMNTVNIAFTGGSSSLDTYQWTVPLYAMLPLDVRVIQIGVFLTTSANATASSPVVLTLSDTIGVISDTSIADLHTSINPTLQIIPSSHVFKNGDGNASALIARFTASITSTITVNVNVSYMFVLYQW